MCDKIRSKEIVVKHVNTEDQIADVLTKAITGGAFTKMADTLLNVPTGGVGVNFNRSSPHFFERPD